jgi:glycerophosphoryl diester phosphodiesterase
LSQSLKFFSGPKPRVIGHRGAAGVAPENTVAALEWAVADRADIVELDVHATRDRQIVVIHDETVDRTTDGVGAVKDMSLAELKRLDAGHRFKSDADEYPFRGRGVTIPSLAELLHRLRGIKAVVEIKQSEPPIVDRVLRIVRDAGKEDDVLLATERDDIMGDIRAALGPNAPIATGFCHSEVASFIETLAHGDLAGYIPPGGAFQIPPAFAGIELVTPASVRAAHALGLEIYVWTVNEATEIKRLLDLGVDGIISDYPARVAAAAGRR